MNLDVTEKRKRKLFKIVAQEVLWIWRQDNLHGERIACGTTYRDLGLLAVVSFRPHFTSF